MNYYWRTVGLAKALRRSAYWDEPYATDEPYQVTCSECGRWVPCRHHPDAPSWPLQEFNDAVWSGEEADQ